jgi:hypothetical protein
MENIVASIRDSIAHENWYGALFTTMVLPDICVSLEQGKSNGSEYSKWFEKKSSAVQ